MIKSGHIHVISEDITVNMKYPLARPRMNYYDCNLNTVDESTPLNTSEYAPAQATEGNL